MASENTHMRAAAVVILVRLSVTGVCGTDIALASGELGPTQPILGHEGVGYIAQLGCNVPVTSSTQIGSRVGISFLRDICGVCPCCMRPGGETRCQRKIHSGRSVNGTFAEYTLVPARYLLRIPESVGVVDELIAPILCGGVTAYTALKGCGVAAGEWIAIVGAGGGVGSLGTQYARAMGYRVLAIDVGETKRGLCLESGAEYFIDAGKATRPRDEVDALTAGCGVRAAIVCATSGVAYNMSLGLIAPFGRLVCVGIPAPDQLASFHPLLLIDQGIEIVGSAVGTKGDILEAIGFVEQGHVKPVITVHGLDELPGLMGDFNQVAGKIVIRM
ncbi:alcohol dehydrogenase [Penicillium cf. viridicatum]|uniref:alcohol dehydrogenase n=1 Tax=Penicillium cf. viridicatum TaxID=2972119 RepID=A0A9W9J928_9EURO|nr:alcohol dehydrogenase [Penicillium cf. viridicatum]